MQALAQQAINREFTDEPLSFKFIYLVNSPVGPGQSPTRMLSLLFPRFTEMVPNDVQGELKHLYTAAGELLRHFWSCFPVNTLFLEEKVTTA